MSKYRVLYRIVVAGQIVEEFSAKEQIDNKKIWKSMDRHSKKTENPVMLLEFLPEYNSWQAIAIIKTKEDKLNLPEGNWKVQ